MMAKGDRLKAALASLDGVGDASLGEWTEYRGAIHIRRRLSIREQIEACLQMIDLRGTKEAAARISKIVQVVPSVRSIAMAELNESSNAQADAPPVGGRG